MKPEQSKLYITYGSNLNLEQMKHRCPTAEIVGKTILRNWRLWFRGADHAAVATIERESGYQVPVLVWRLQPTDELALDHYEGHPRLYRKETLRITVNGRRVYAMVYLMNTLDRPCGAPSAYYFNTILSGYRCAGFDPAILDRAVNDSRKDFTDDRED